MSTVVKNYKGASNNTVLLKGAFENVISRCTRLSLDNGSEVDFSEETKKAMIAKITDKAAQGFRVLGIAIGLDGGNMKHITQDNRREELADSSKYAHFEGNLAFVGYVCIKDPVRPEVKKAIQDCKTAGINVIMITGDNKETAIAVAKELNIIEEGQNLAKTCFTGAEFEPLNVT